MPDKDALLNSFCHHLPDRLLIYGDGCSILCARCSGIYLGFLLGIVAFLLIRRRKYPSLTVRDLWLPGILIVLLPLEVAAENFLGFSTTNFVRYLTGIGLGAGFAMFLAALWCGFFAAAPSEEKAVSIELTTFAPLTVGAAFTLVLLLPPVFNGLVFLGLFASYFIVNILLIRGVFGVKKPIAIGALAFLLVFVEWSMLFVLNNYVIRQLR